jgi:hypothetical protein
VARREGLTIQVRWQGFLRGFQHGEAALVAGDTESGDGVLGDATCGVGGARGGVLRAGESKRGRAMVAFALRMK